MMILESAVAMAVIDLHFSLNLVFEAVRQILGKF